MAFELPARGGWINRQRRQFLVRKPSSRARARLRNAGAQSISADVYLAPSGRNANRDDIRSPMPRSKSRRNRHSLAPAFSPGRWAGKKFPSCGLRQKKCLQSSSRDSPARDTSFRAEEGVRVFSYAFDCKRITTVRHATGMHKCSLGIVEERFQSPLQVRVPFATFASIIRIVTVVSAENAAAAELRWIFIRRLITLARLRVNENRSSF